VATQADVPADLQRLDQVRLVMTVRRIAASTAEDALVLSLDVARDEAFDERGMVGLISAVPGMLGQQTLWSLSVRRNHVGLGDELTEARADVRLDLVTPTPDVAAARDCLEALLRDVRELARWSRRDLTRDEAVALACDLVDTAWSTGVDTLRVTDEQHRPDPPSWRVGLVDSASTRFRVDLGTADGDPHTARLRRRDAAEVADSVGEFG
jgi:hypothetical protein